MSNLKEEALKELIQRFAISALSRERKGEALNEEILVGKYTGEFYIKTKDGIVLSTDILNRLKASTDDAIRIAELVGMKGDLFRVTFDEMVLPNHIDYSVNILENEPIELPVGSTDLLINLDYDEYDIVGSNFIPVNTNARIKISLEAGEQTLVIEKALQNINYNVISLEDLQNMGTVQISGIVIEKDEDMFNEESLDRTILLHNIFVTVNN